MLAAVGLLFALSSSASSKSAHAADAVDTVVLKSGGKLRGVVMEQDPRTGVSIKLLDGTTRAIPAADVASVEYGSPASASPPPAVSAPSAAAPGVPTGPSTAPVRSTPPADGAIPAQHMEDHVTHGIPAIWIPGLVIFLTTYATAIAVVAATADDRVRGKSIGYAAIPLFGAIPAFADEDARPEGAGNYAAIIAGTILENVGMAMFIGGLAAPRHHQVMVNNAAPLPVDFNVTPEGGRVRLQLRF